MSLENVRGFLKQLAHNEALFAQIKSCKKVKRNVVRLPKLLVMISLRWNWKNSLPSF
ncbi:MAG: Nif11 family protein [Nostocaceae cyanobacterium CSU_2_110]|nr:Nif11 family protein [Nostocaceae cyanobacterium CSU_2_110]